MSNTQSPAVGVSAAIAVTMLRGEGFPWRDIESVLDDLMDAGLMLTQPDNDTVLHDDEIQIIRERLADSRHAIAA